jgi:hypothetical protein
MPALTEAAPGGPDIRWAPYTGIGTPDPAIETEEPPDGTVVIHATGCRDGHSVVYWSRPGKPYQRITCPPCQACGTWTCAACGWQRTGAAMDRPEEQRCNQCGCHKGTFSPTRHQHRTGLWEAHNPVAGPACENWRSTVGPPYKPFEGPCKHPSCRTITWKA